LTQIFVESCVDFEVAHYLSVFIVWRLPYPEVPTLSSHFTELYMLMELHTYRSKCTTLSMFKYYTQSICI